MDAAASWLTQQGFTVHGAARGGLSISFSGSAAQVGKAFRTAIVEYDVDGIRRHGNATAISIPQGLTGFTAGVASLNDMPRKHYTVRYGLKPGATRISPEVDTTQGNAVGAGDFATIYDLNPLFPGTTGKGVTIAVVGETNITLSDQTSFVTNFGLNTYNGSFAVVTPSGVAAAPGADIRLVLFPSTLTTQGVDLSAQYIVDNKYAPILTLSYGECENALGTAGNAFWEQLWEQAASEGISVFVASGDSGAAGCDAVGGKTATGGRAVSGIASTPYNTAGLAGGLRCASLPADAPGP